MNPICEGIIYALIIFSLLFIYLKRADIAGAIYLYETGSSLVEIYHSDDPTWEKPL